MTSARFVNALWAPALASFIFFGSGCTQPTSLEINELHPRYKELRADARKIIAQLEPGMSLQEVKELWSDDVYPWKSETQLVIYATETKRIIIQWYYTDLVKNDGRVTDNELTTVVFEQEGEILGWGRDFLPQLYIYIEKQRKAQED